MNFLDLSGCNVSALKGVGPKSLAQLNRMGIYTLYDLVNFYPRAYEDWSNPQKIYDIYHSAKPGCVKLTIISEVKKKSYNKKVNIFKVTGSDGENNVDIVIFGSRYADYGLLKGNDILVLGSIKKNASGYEMVSPKISLKSGIKSVYTQSKTLSSKKIENLIKASLEQLRGNFEDTLPERIRNKYNLCSLEFAVNNIHFPSDMQDVETAKRRLIFEELLVWQISMSMLKNYVKYETDVMIVNDYSDEFISLLPFSPTGAQSRVIKECTEDMMQKDGLAMARLLQGDVGSGKTVIAAALAYNMAKNGYQTAVMVPTEILSVQHFNTFKKILDKTGINIGIISGGLSTHERRTTEAKIKNGETDIIIGTHALISEKLEFANLGLVITDEQHRFGVKQRAKLINKGKNPHMMIMSATPIPRTLSMIIYADLDISVLDELPPGRMQIETYCINSKKRQRAFNFMKKILDSGGQGYIICPSIENFDEDISSIDSYKQGILKKEFSGYNTEILHGRMPADERSSIMQKFSEGFLHILVSTTVIEVGLDVPNASIIIIENAERFGLSQLHQLRGRVGRGSKKSYCILISDSDSDEAKKRFKAMCATNDGFYLANEDLNIRGPGEIFGSKQHGITGTIKLAKNLSDMSIAKQSKEAVKEILDGEYNMQKDELKFIKRNVRQTIDKLQNRTVM